MSAGAAQRTALVTGGAGFIGSHLAERLVRDGWRVRVLDDLSAGRESNLAGFRERIDFLEGDLRHRPLLECAVEGAEVVFHEAAVPSVPRSVAEPEHTHSVNVDGTLAVLEVARHAGVRRVVFAASSSAYGETPELPKLESMPPRPLSPYALQKVTGEQYARLYHRLYGLETVSLRYFNVFGPRQDPASEYAAVIPKFVTACLAGRSPVIFGDGEQTRDFTFVQDVVDANLLAADSPKASGEVINVAGGHRVSLNELLAEIVSLTGADVRADHQPQRPGDVRHSQAGVELARELLDWSVRVPLREGLARTIEYFRAVRGGA